METVIGGIVFFVLGSMASYVGWKNVTRWYTIHNTDSVSIQNGMFDDDVVAMSGSVIPVEETLLRSPLEQTPCVAYDFMISRVSSGDHKTVDFGDDAQPFIIDDGTATAYVPPDAVNVIKERLSDVDRENFREDVTTQPNLRGNRKYKEGTIEPGEEVFVVGTTENTHRPDSDTKITDAGGSFLASNKPRENTKRKALKRSLFLPLGLFFTLFGLVVLMGELLPDILQLLYAISME